MAADDLDLREADVGGGRLGLCSNMVCSGFSLIKAQQQI